MDKSLETLKAQDFYDFDYPLGDILNGSSCCHDLLGNAIFQLMTTATGVKWEHHSSIKPDRPETWSISIDAKAECQLPHNDSCNLKLYYCHRLEHPWNQPYHEGMMFSCGGGVHWYLPQNEVLYFCDVFTFYILVFFDFCSNCTLCILIVHDYLHHH